jgi:perosamine synthetase
MIRVFEPDITFRDKFSILKTLNKKQISGSGDSVYVFENLIKEKIGRKYAVAVSNGSVALELSLLNIELEPGDEVILPSFTIISCLSAVVRSGAKPVFCDVDKKSWNMRLEDVQPLITNKTKAIIIVHTYGLTAEIDTILAYCEEKNIIVIEDAAESHGQVFNKKFCGSFGKISTFSFYANKHLTTGEGGMLLTDDEKIYKNLLQMRNLDFLKDRRFYHNNFYWNYRLSSIQAALGISQLENLNKTISNKIKQGEYYLELLSEHKNLFHLPLREDKEVKNHFWVFGVLLKQEGLREKLMNKMSSNKIETRPFFFPLHLQPALKKSIVQTLPVTENLGLNGLYIPLGSHLSRKKQRYIVDKLVSSTIELLN